MWLRVTGFRLSETWLCWYLTRMRELCLLLEEKDTSLPSWLAWEVEKVLGLNPSPDLQSVAAVAKAESRVGGTGFL